MTNHFTPVIIGVGEICNRSQDPAVGQEPIDSMALALRAAEADASAAVVGAIDSIDLVGEHSFTITELTELDNSPVGRRGEVFRSDNNLLIWRNS